MTDGPEPSAVAWHTESADDALSRLNSTAAGLTDTEADERLREHGLNELRRAPGRGVLMRLLSQFHNVLLYVLLVAGAMTVFIGEWLDASVIFGVVFINAIVGFVQEGKAERALDAIRDLLAPNATVRRASRRQTIPASEIVPGDIVLLQSGDKVPADLRLLRTKNLQIQESALTGESVPVEKATVPLAPDTTLADRTCLAFSGTMVTYGQGTGVVVATGERTEIGRVSELLRRVETIATPLLRQIARFSRWLSFAIAVIAGLTFAFGVWIQGYAVNDMFLAAVGLAVAAIPEGLPPVMTITLAIGVERMARRQAIIRRLPAVETLGSVSVICSDKTGTLTKNEMTVRTIATSDRRFDVSGAGYVPFGAFLLHGEEVALERQPLLREMTLGAFLCSDATLHDGEEGWSVDGDPTEGALVSVAMKAGIDPEFEAKAWPRTDVIPFESEHRFMATLHHDHTGKGAIYVKGAPERLLEMCALQQGDSGVAPLNLSYWHRQMEEIAAYGQRVLALAVKRTDSEHRQLVFGDVDRDLTLLGFFGLSDPPREEAVTAVASCQAAGIRVKMITGDHARTAQAIAGELGLQNKDRVLTGAELGHMDEAAIRDAAADTDVFARTSPEDKLRLVRALQARSQIVAMTGDGVNDAPALKRADVGVAMGEKGTEAAKEAAAMVLGDDNFATIAHAVEEGRTIYDNLKKAIIFLLPTSGGEALMILVAILMGSVLPITPVQILWINMITAVTLGIALAFEPAETDVMRRPPRAADEPLLSRFLVWRVVFVSLILLVGTFGLFLLERERGASLEAARTVAVNTLVLFEAFYLFNSRFLRQSVLTRNGLLGSRAVLIAVAIVVAMQFVFTYAPPMQALFETRPLSVVSWALAVLVASSVLFLVEAEKYVVARLRAPDR